MFPRVGRGVVCGACCSLYILQVSASSFGEEKWLATFLSAAGHREAFHRLGVQDVAEFVSD
jgi:hypothetical protein